LQNEEAKVIPSIVSPFPMKHDALRTKIISEVYEAHIQMIRLKETIQKCMSR